jgi:hypothetical protein
LSFFDEADEPLTEPRMRRPSGGGGRPPRRGGRSPREQQQYMVRRVVAGAVLLVVVIVLALGIHSCEVSQRNTALRNYATSVAALVADSHQTAQSLFSDLSRGGGGVSLQNEINSLASGPGGALSQLSRVKGLSVPDEMKTAQGHVVLAFQMRYDAIRGIASEIQSALSKTGADAVNAIAADIGNLYGSDAVYKNYAGKEIAAALHGVGITPNSLNGPTISDLQFVPNLQWLTPSFVAAKLGTSVQGPHGKPSPGTHGSELNSCSVAGTTLLTTGGNSLAANPPPTFSCTFTDTGQNNETDVTVKVQVSGTSIKGQTVEPQTTAGQQYTVQISLNSAPPTGVHTVTATVEPVPGETVTSNNTQSYPVTFH